MTATARTRETADLRTAYVEALKAGTLQGTAKSIHGTKMLDSRGVWRAAQQARAQQARARPEKTVDNVHSLSRAQARPAPRGALQRAGTLSREQRAELGQIKRGLDTAAAGEAALQAETVAIWATHKAAELAQAAQGRAALLGARAALLRTSGGGAR